MMPNKLKNSNDLEKSLPPSPSLLRRVEEHWKKNLPKAYAKLPPGQLRKSVQNAEDQIALLVSQGYDLPGAREVVYPDLFPEPEGSEEQEETS